MTIAPFAFFQGTIILYIVYYLLKKQLFSAIMTDKLVFDI